MGMLYSWNLRIQRLKAWGMRGSPAKAHGSGLSSQGIDSSML